MVQAAELSCVEDDAVETVLAHYLAVDDAPIEVVPVNGSQSASK